MLHAYEISIPSRQIWFRLQKMPSILTRKH